MVIPFSARELLLIWSTACFFLVIHFCLKASWLKYQLVLCKMCFELSQRLCKKKKVRGILTLGPVQEQPKMLFKMTVTQFTDGSVAFQDSKGNPAPIDGNPTITVSPDGIVALEINPDNSFKLTSLGVGNCVLQIAADADLGAGVENVLVTQDIEVVAGKAVTGVINLAAPQEQP